MSLSTHPIIVPSDYDVEDAFSTTHSPDDIPASPEYFPASPRNTSPDPSDDLSKYLLASLAISPFHDDPYMKVMQAYDATNNESPIPLPRAPIAPPTILPSSQVLPLSPMFDPQDFFLPEKILPSQKRACSWSSTFTSALPQVFEVGESSHKTSLERHEEQVETILNHLDELLLKRIEHINCIDDCKVKFATGTLTEEALSWWYSFYQPIRIKEAYKITWSDFKNPLIKKYCLRTEIKKMEDEFYNLIIKGNDLKTYIRRFQELAFLCPTMVPNSEKLMEVFIGGLPKSIEENVTASKP
ncbi:reverse transcriptase domain-containing protein [Tanacetum coccineum]